MTDSVREALEYAAEHFSSDWPERCQTIVRTARAALAAQLAQESFDAWQENQYTKVLQKSIAEDYVPRAQPAQEPVAWMHKEDLEAVMRFGGATDCTVEGSDLGHLVPLYAAPVAAQPAQALWVSVADQMPDTGRIVLACYVNSNDKLRRVRAKWVAAKTEESGSESDIGEYDEETDCYYDPEGWYECIDNWDDYTAVAISDPVTHWMPLPVPPEITP